MTETIAQNDKKAISKMLPSDMSQVAIVAKYDVLKYLRSRRLLGIIAIEALVPVLITALPPLLGNQYPTDADQFINRYAGFTSLLVVIGATLFAGDAIVSEFQGRTGYLLFPNPVKRSVLLAGKFIASTGAMFLVLIVYYGIALVLGVAITGGFSTLGVESLLLAMLYSIAALAVGYLISSVMKGSTGSLILTFALFLFIFSIITSVLSLSGVEPWFILTFAGGTIADITQVPYPVTTTTNIGNGAQAITLNNYIPDVGVAIAVMVAYAVVALLLAYVFFKRREMSA
jgi:ABC-2 type transport system permease protein